MWMWILRSSAELVKCGSERVSDGGVTFKRYSRSFESRDPVGSQTSSSLLSTVTMPLSCLVPLPQCSQGHRGFGIVPFINSRHFETGISGGIACSNLFAANTIRYDTIVEFNVDSKGEYSALSSTRSQKKTKTNKRQCPFNAVQVKIHEGSPEWIRLTIEGKDLWKGWVLSFNGEFFTFHLHSTPPVCMTLGGGLGRWKRIIKWKNFYMFSCFDTDIILTCDRRIDRQIVSDCTLWLRGKSSRLKH